MKEVKKLFILALIVICLIPFKVMAAGSVTVSKSSITLTKGKSTTFVIKANNSAGRINISTSNSGVASISSSSVFLDMQSITITIKGVSAGTATITVSLADVTTYDDEDLSGKKYTISVKVNNPVVNNDDDDNSNNNENNNLSKNNKIKTLSIEGYKLIKVDNNNYTLTVNNNVESIKINATAEDSKSKITGTGVHKLNIGQNKIEVIVTSESGAKNKIILKVTRKDAYYIEDLDEVLKEKSLEDISINSDSKIPSDTLIKIKGNGKKIKFNYHDKDKKLIYSWSVDGTKLNNTNEFSTALKFDTENAKEINTMSNYAFGIYLHFNHSGTLPEGTKIKVYVGDKFENDSLVNLYYYNQDKKQLESVKKGLKVESEYVEFDIEHCSEYFMTMSDIKAPVMESNIVESTPINTFKIVSIIELFLIIVFIVIDYLGINPIIKLKKSK